ncbi:site-specific integrase [Agathobaculum sp.]|uniref:site-specific integrase n=1 Tax=Agathobaculum sp. TaxID=2048138 RepID=UPI002A831EA5|nr:site-specific integrase [Agathobaculum sp.]MDY3618037.1 site-specific integrase [Agathobaculum sp.]
MAKHHLIFSFRNGGDGRNGAGSTPQNTVATVASVALYFITSKFLSKSTMSCNMTFQALTELYFEDMSTRLKATTISNKRYLFDTKLLPYFRKLPIDKITPAHIRKWQNDLIGHEKDYAPTYLKTTNNQLSAVFNYAVKYYNLSSNPCRIAGSMGKKDADEMQIWTVDQFKQAMKHCKRDNDRLAFEIMFYGGLRIGETLALTPADIDESKVISITKSYTRLHGEDVISTPKTPKSIRDVTIPTFLYEHIQSYIASLYGVTPDTRLFTWGKGTLNRALKT